jgi:hypothetical protein
MSVAALTLAGLAAVCSVALATFNAISYVRHMDTGDQAGFALGMFFLNSYVLPFAGATTMSAVTSAERASARGLGPPFSSLAWAPVLSASGALLLVFAAAMGTVTLLQGGSPPRWPDGLYDLLGMVFYSSSMTNVLAYGLLLAVAGVAFWTVARPSTGRRPLDGIARSCSWAGWALLVSLVLFISSTVGTSAMHATMPNVGGTPWGHARTMLLTQSPTLVFALLLAVALVLRPRRPGRPVTS